MLQPPARRHYPSCRYVSKGGKNARNLLESPASFYRAIGGVKISDKVDAVNNFKADSFAGGAGR